MQSTTFIFDFYVDRVLLIWEGFLWDGGYYLNCLLLGGFAL